jgi:hypothetical protein
VQKILAPNNRFGYEIKDHNKHAFQLLLHSAFLSRQEMLLFEGDLVNLLSNPVARIYKEVDEDIVTSNL